MPLHDWTRVLAGTFHDFHYIWVAELRHRLNRGLLPEGFYAQAEQVAGGSVPDVLTLHDGSGESATPIVPPNSAIGVLETPPRVFLTQDAEERLYARKRDRIAIRHRSGDRTVALIDVVSPGNKHSIHELRRFLAKIDSAIERGIHCLVIDVHPPGKHDPMGLHAAFWEFAFGEPAGLTNPSRATLASYRANPNTIATAYVQPVGIGESLPDMPLFLDPDWYVNVPLEETYLKAWEEFPDRWKKVVAARE